MNDESTWEALGRIAESQGGYVTTKQAQSAGLHRNTLLWQAREGGRLERVSPGLFRLRFFPPSAFEHIVRLWAQVGMQIAVVSHESALEVYRLSDVAPSKVHFILPRKYRYRRAPLGAQLHFPETSLNVAEIRNVQGLKVTSPERSIVDALEAGSQHEQIQLAVGQSLDRMLITKQKLVDVAQKRSKRTLNTIEGMLEQQ